MNEPSDPWFVFRIEGTDSEGVDVPRLARLLTNLSSAFYAIARSRIGSAPGRPGRRSTNEETLAGVRIIRIVPGSTSIELAPPAAAQARLPIGEPTADDVAFDFYEETRRIANGEPPDPGRLEIRRHVREVVAEAGEIGSRAEVAFTPRVPLADHAPDVTLRASLPTRDLPQESLPRRATLRRRFSGHAYMVDVEPGRQRVRLKLPDGRDLTFDVDDSLAGSIPNTLDKAVEVEVDEELEDEIPARRTARGLRLLPSAGSGSDRPPKSIEELAREQHMPKQRPDYRALASAVWQTAVEVDEFEKHVHEIRQAAHG